MYSRREPHSYMREWEADVLEDLNDMIELLGSIQFLLSESTGVVRVPVQLTVGFILSQTSQFFPPGTIARMTDVQSLTALLGGIDAGGNVTQLDPTFNPIWTVSDPELLTVTPASNGQSAAIQATGAKVGSANLLIQGPATQTLPAPAQAQIVVGYSAGKLGVTFGKPK